MILLVAVVLAIAALSAAGWHAVDVFLPTHRAIRIAAHATLLAVLLLVILAGAIRLAPVTAVLG